MTRRLLLLVPALGGLAAGVGVILQAPLVAVIVGVVLGVAAALAIATGFERHLLDVIDRVRRLARGETSGTGAPASVSRQVAADLAEVGEALRQRSEDLARERRRVERLLDALPTAILFFAPDGLTYANPSAQELFGVGRQELRSPFQVLGVEALAKAVAEVRETGRSLDLEADREERHLTAHASPTGEEIVALIVTDVTDARRLEAVRRDFVTNASHELKTPVAGMQALADSLTLAVDRDPERTRSMIRRLQSEAVRLGQLVRDLLDLARLEEDAAGGGGRRRVDLAELVRDQVERLDDDARQLGVKVRVDSSGPAPLVAQAGDLRLIVANLLENAVHYNRPGGRVDVRVERTASEVVLEVEDNGIGIPEADRDRVFERFYRVDKARSRAAGGTGLGLAIVRHATERHGGEVTVRSVLGEGSFFRVVLPVEGTPSGG